MKDVQPNAVPLNEVGHCSHMSALEARTEASALDVAAGSPYDRRREVVKAVPGARLVHRRRLVNDEVPKASAALEAEAAHSGECSPHAIKRVLHEHGIVSALISVPGLRPQRVEVPIRGCFPKSSQDTYNQRRN